MLVSIKHDEFEQMYKIMENSFPSDEYRPYNEQKALLQNETYTLYVNKDDNGLINAFIAIWNFEDFNFIEHFAVSAKFRNCGIGSDILSDIKLLSDKICCLEVEIPIGEYEKKRVSFYERNGFCLNTYSYTQPPISQGKNPVPLMIMTSGRSITAEEFENIKRVLYKEVYKVCL